MGNMIGDALGRFDEWSGQGQNASNLGYILDQLGSKIAPNNPFAGIGTQMAQGKVATQEVARQNKSNQAFIQNLMGTLTAADQNGPSKISATTDEAGNINYKIDGVSSSGQAEGAVTPSGQGPGAPAPVSSAPVDMSILPLEMISNLAKRNQGQMDFRTELLAKLAGREPAEQTIPLLVQGSIVDVPLGDAPGFINSEANMRNANSLKALREAKTPQEIAKIKSDILRNENQTRIEDQKTVSTTNLQGAQQAKIEAETVEIPRNDSADRMEATTQAHFNRERALMTQAKRNQMDEELAVLQANSDSLITHRDWLKTSEGQRKPMTELEKAQLNKLHAGLPIATSKISSDISNPYPVRYEAASSYNKATNSTLGFYGTVPIEKWGPDTPGEIKQVYLPYNKVLGRVMTMEDVRKIAEDKGVSIEEVVRFIDEQSQKGIQ